MEMILKKIRGNEPIKIVETPHFAISVRRKYCSYELTYYTLKNKIPLKIIHSKDNKFRIIYDHEDSTKYNIIIVSFIENKNEIRLITTFPENKTKLNQR
jgi:hypothetical protein